MIKSLIAALGLALVLGSLPAYADQGSADAQFRAIYQQGWAWRAQEFGISTADVKRHAQLDTVDAASQQRRLEHWLQVQTKLKAIDPQQLSLAEQMNYAVYRRQIDVYVAEQQFKTWEMPFNSDSAFWSSIG